MINNSNIKKIVSLLAKEVKKFDLPMAESIAEKYKDPFFVLVSALLSSRTKDELTEKVVIKLFKKIKGPKDLLAVSKRQLEKLIYPIGFYHTKTKHLIQMAKILIQKYHGKVPETFNDLLELPGVGRKVANLVLIVAFHAYGICVDTHVHRIVNRWGYVKTQTPEETEFALRKKLPRMLWKKINTILVSYGKNICKPITPLCEMCKINRYCNTGTKALRHIGAK